MAAGGGPGRGWAPADPEGYGHGQAAAAAVGRAARGLVRAALAVAGAGRGLWRAAEALDGPWRSRYAAAAANLGRGGAEEAGCQRGQGPVAEGTSVAAVLGNDDLLHEILLRLGFTSCLVRTSLVCKRWYLLASSPALLRRFRELHPPRVLGFYIELQSHGQIRQRFVPLPQPDELQAVVLRSRSHLELDFFEDIVACWNGCILTSSSFDDDTVRWPLDRVRERVRLPPPPENPNYFYIHDIFPSNDDGHFFCLQIGCAVEGQQTVMDVYKLSQDDGVWAIHTSATVDIQDLEPYAAVILVGTRICMLAMIDDPILVMLDLASSSFSMVELPQEVEDQGDSYSQLSRVDDDSIYLILVKGLQIHVWTHQANGGNWSLVNSICLREMCGGLPKNGSNSSVKLCRGGIQAELVHLHIGCFVYLLDTRRKTLHKVYELTPKDARLRLLVPFLMTWPPVFPVVNNGCHDHKE